MYADDIALIVRDRRNMEGVQIILIKETKNKELEKAKQDEIYRSSKKRLNQITKVFAS